jgi:hypothetical protein
MAQPQEGPAQPSSTGVMAANVQARHDQVELSIEVREPRAIDLLEPAHESVPTPPSLKPLPATNPVYRHAYLSAATLERFESEHVADDGCGEVRDRSLLEQVAIVDNVSEVLCGDPGHRIQTIGFRL